MRLFRDLYAAAPRRTALVVALIAFGASGQAVAAALAGPVLLYRSTPLYVALIATLFIGVTGDLMVRLVSAWLTADWSATVRRQLCRVALGQDLPTLESTPVGELLDRIDGDVYQVAAEVRGSGIRIAFSATVGIVSAVIALFMWWPAGVLMVVLLVGLIMRLRGKAAAITPLRMSEEEAWSDLAAVMEEAIHGQDDVRTTLARPYVLRLYARRAATVLERARRVFYSSARITLTAAATTRGGIALIVIGGAWALEAGYVNGARLTAVWLLALAYGGTVEQVSRMVPELQYALGAWGRISLLRASAQESTDGVEPVEGDMVVRHLTFRYATDGRPAALHDLNLTFARGRSYAVIGRTGSGKSTLAKVLTRAVDVPRGTVYLAGHDVTDLDVERLRQMVALVPQRTDILAGTLAENVALFDPDLLDRAGAALDELGLADWVADLPDGLDTRLGDGGQALSAGQEQLVAFARILVRNPYVVILDEATARLDPVTEARVQRATERLLADRIGIVIAHRLSSVERCDQVIVLADGALVESGPLGKSARFKALLATSNAAEPVIVGSAGTGTSVLTRPAGGDASPTRAESTTSTKPAEADTTAVAKVDAPELPEAPKARTLREIVRLTCNDPRFGLSSVALFTVLMVFGLDGSALPSLWANLVDGSGSVVWPAALITTALLLTSPVWFFTGRWFPEWWVRQMLRISARLVYGQTGPRRISEHTPAAVIAQAGDTERVVILADNTVDQATSVVTIVAMTLISASFVPAGFFAGTMIASGLAATAFGPRLAASARRTVAARAAFATALVSSLSAARTVKLAGATEPVLAHLARLDRERSDLQRREISLQVWARSTPSILAGLLPIAAWALYLYNGLSAEATLVIISVLGAAQWFAWTTASLVSQMPSARVWTKRTVAMAGIGAYSARVPGMDIGTGAAPAPEPAPRRPLNRLELCGFGAVHEDGTLAARGVNLTVDRGDLVLVVGPVGSGKSSLLRALAGIVHHDGRLIWNEEQVTEPEVFLRPNQVGYVAQLPRVFSGTVAENIQLGHDIEANTAVTTAQLDHDLAAAGSGLSLLIGHKGTRLSGGQLQRLALARALAPRTELLIADDVSSALDVTTELALWQALRERGVTVIGSTSKRAALRQADKVVVLQSGAAVAQGTWTDLEAQWGHLAG